MRGLVTDLTSPHPLGTLLPGVYQEDEFAQRLTSAFDDVLAPVLCTLDNRHAYFDPALAPDDFVRWLAEWVGVSLDENWPLDRQRALISFASELYRGRGTIKGLAAHLELYTGASPEIEDNGGCAWSPTPNGSPPGRAAPSLVVRLRQRERAPFDPARIDAIVGDVRPAHVPYRIEMVDA